MAWLARKGYETLKNHQNRPYFALVANESCPKWIRPPARRVWDLNPRRLSPHTLSKRAHSAALATLPAPRKRVRIAEGIVWLLAPVSGCGDRVLCNGSL